MSAIVLVTAAIFATWWGGLPFAILWALAGTVFAYEWFGLIAPKSIPKKISVALSIMRILIAISVGTLPLLICFETPLVILWSAIVAIVIASIVWVWLIRRSQCTLDKERWQQAFGRYIGLWAFSGVFLGSVVGLVPVYARAVPVIGLTLIAWMFAVVWTTDIAAYFTGRALGGPKLCPRISPNKTWAGFLGGTLAGALMGWVIAHIVASAGNALSWSMGSLLAASLFASIAGQAGDLAESAFKRRAGVKDSGVLIPGHGGVMDRLDGFVAVCLLVAAALLSGVLIAG